MNAFFGTVLALTFTLALAGCGTVGAATVTAKGLTSRTAPAAQKTQRPAAKPVQILVKFKAARMTVSALEAFRSEFSTRNVGQIAALGIYIEELAPGTNMKEALAAIEASPLVEYAEPNSEVTIQN
jgi:hypothetical protein